MEKVCGFCRALRPVVYCKSDAAHLCLSCDAKIHSANALSNRHPRTLVCEECRYLPAYVRCSDHRMFMCRGCDCSLHGDFSPHQKQVISSYLGCPSAKDFAVLWGFGLNELESRTLQDGLVSTSCVSVDNGVENSDFPRQSMSFPQTGGPSLASQVGTVTSILGAKSEAGPSSHHTEVYNEGKLQQNTCIILQQILDLERLQLAEGHKNSSLIRGKQQTEISSSMYDTAWKLDNNLDQSLWHPLGLGADPHQELNVEPFSSPFPPLEQLTSSSTVGNPLQGEPFWQSAQSFQLWSQNLQDLGICEEPACNDDLNIPDVDMTFRNFEELFGCDQDLTTALLDDKYMTCSSVNKDTSLDGLGHSYAKEIEDASVASSVYIVQSANLSKDIGPSDQASHCFSNEGCFRPIRPSYSTLSASLSRFSAESNSTDYMDSCFSPVITRHEPPCNSHDSKSSELEAKGNAMLRYKDKKNMRQYEKQIQYAPQKARADARKNVRGRFVKPEGYESDNIDVT